MAELTINKKDLIKLFPNGKEPACYLCGVTFKDTSLRPIGLDFQWICWECKGSSSKVEQICSFNYDSIVRKCCASETGVIILENKELKPWPEELPKDEETFPLKVGVYSMQIREQGSFAIYFQVTPEITIQIC